MSDDIVIHNLTVSFARKTVFEDLNLTIKSPGITCLIGPNGCGKTTLIRSLMKFIPYKGEITFGEKTLKNVRDKIGLVLDEPPFYGNISVKQNLDLLMDVKAVDDEKAKEVFKELNIDDAMLKARADKLSFGQRHRIAVAGAVLRDPQYIFLDEPSVGMDPESFVNLSNCLLSEVKRGKCILVTGHDFELIDLIADNVAVLSEGKCSFCGTKDKFKTVLSKGIKAGSAFSKAEIDNFFKEGGSKVE